MADWPIIPAGYGYPLVEMDTYRLPQPVMDAIGADTTAQVEDPESNLRQALDTTIGALVAPKANSADVYTKTAADAATASAIASGLDGQRTPYISDALPYPPLTMVSTMQTGHGWTASGTGATGTLNDTADFILGSQAAKVTTNGAGATASLLKTGLTLDLTDKGLLVWLKIDATTISKVAFISIDLAVDSSFVTRYRYVFPGLDKAPIKLNEWCPVFINWASFLGATISGSPTRSTLTAIRVNAVDNNSGESIGLHVGGVATFADTPTAFPNGVISLCFDDSHDVRNSLDYMGIYGFTGTLFPILSRLDTGGYLTTAQVLQYNRARGFEIGAHATDEAHHVDWTPQTLGWVQTELTALRNWQAANNIPGSSFAWPNGTYDATLANAVQKFYSFSRTNGTFVDTALTPKPFRLSAQVINASATLAFAKSLVDQAKAGRGWQKFIFHNIVASGASGNDWLRSDFNALMDYIAAQGVAVVPLGQVPRRMMVG